MKQLVFPFYQQEHDRQEALRKSLEAYFNQLNLGDLIAEWYENHIKYGGVFTHHFDAQQNFLDELLSSV